MENILEKLYWVFEEKNLPSQQLSETTDDFHKHNCFLLGHLEGEEIEAFRKFAKSANEITGIVERENFIHGLKFGVRLMVEVLAN